MNKLIATIKKQPIIIAIIGCILIACIVLGVVFMNKNHHSNKQATPTQTQTNPKQTTSSTKKATKTKENKKGDEISDVQNNQINDKNKALDKTTYKSSAKNESKKSFFEKMKEGFSKFVQATKKTVSNLFQHKKKSKETNAVNVTKHANQHKTNDSPNKTPSKNNGESTKGEKNANKKAHKVLTLEERKQLNEEKLNNAYTVNDLNDFFTSQIVPDYRELCYSVRDQTNYLTYGLYIVYKRNPELANKKKLKDLEQKISSLNNTTFKSSPIDPDINNKIFDPKLSLAKRRENYLELKPIILDQYLDNLHPLLDETQQLLNEMQQQNDKIQEQEQLQQGITQMYHLINQPKEIESIYFTSDLETYNRMLEKIPSSQHLQNRPFETPYQWDPIFEKVFAYSNSFKIFIGYLK